MTPGRDPRDTVGSMYNCYTPNMKALGLAVLKDCFSHDAPGAWPILTPGARLAGFIKRTFIQCNTYNRKALGFGEDFLCISQPKLWELMTPPGSGPFWTPGA